jgi:hypothetical protein
MRLVLILARFFFVLGLLVTISVADRAVPRGGMAATRC